MYTAPNGLTPVDITAIVFVVLTIIGLAIVYNVLKRIIRKIAEVWSKGNIFGSDVKTRLISLGVVAILFPNIFYFIGSAIIHFIESFYVDLPQSLVRNWQTNQGFCQTYNPDLSFCVTQLGSGFIQAWALSFSKALNYFGPSYIPYSKLVLMLAVWTGIALLLSASTSKDKDRHEGAEPETRLQHLIDHLSPTTKQNLMFFLILVLAGYLSIAAIAAIPGLEETAVPSEAVSAERLEQQLQDALTKSQARIPEQLQFSEPIATPTGILASPTATDEPTSAISTINNDYFLKTERSQWSSMYSKLRDDVIDQAENLKASAISTYRASVIDRKGTKETNQHFLDIDAWYRQELNRMEGQLADCRRRIINSDSTIRILITQLNDIQSTNTINQALQNADQETREACQSVSAARQVPDRQDLGSNMGPFSYIASWLLRTESLPLAQIVGLLGFGLLGSAVSSLVRNNRRRPKDQPLVEELATVIIRGATAAVVVFLAVKGGLAIFTSGESNPNSYVLLLTCLVAAVYSEDVWAEAHNRLNKGLKGDDDTPPAQPTPTPEPPAALEVVTSTPSSTELSDDESNQKIVSR